MSRSQKLAILALRLTLGWLFFYAGISKIVNPNWTAGGYQKGAQSLTGLYDWLALPVNIGWVSFLAVWGLLLIGLSLLFGFLTRWASLAGIIMMALFYFPALNFPRVGTTSYIIDDHIIYIAIFVFLAFINAGEFWGLDSYFFRHASKGK